ncbi:MAG: helix-turn-helix transcriptional regulator [Phycisphaerales bacterium]|nr:helix-turn-helix transcriptional regulator [Phycisphaerales bacterium]
MDNNKKIAAKIRELREHKSILQSYIATKLDISPNTYSRIESGHTQITINNLFKICEALDITVNELIGKTVGSNVGIQNNLLSPFNNGNLHLTLTAQQIEELKRVLTDK